MSIILLNVLIAIVSKAYDNAISKGRRNFLSARLNIAALYGAMGLTKENTANVTMHGWRKTVQEKFEDRYPSIYGKLMYSREKNAFAKEVYSLTRMITIVVMKKTLHRKVEWKSRKKCNG